MDPINLNFDVSPDQWKQVRAAFGREGVDVPDEAAGEIHRSGVKARFTYDGSRLAVTVYDKPLLYPAGVVMTKLKTFIEEAIA